MPSRLPTDDDDDDDDGLEPPSVGRWGGGVGGGAGGGRGGGEEGKVCPFFTLDKVVDRFLYFFLSSVDRNALGHILPQRQRRET